MSDSKEEILEHQNISFKFALARTQGKRESMQDCNFPDSPETNPEITKNTFFFGIYDGHSLDRSDSGASCARYTAEHLHSNIIESPNFLSQNISKAIIDGYLKTDEDFCKLGIDGGTTASTILFEKLNLWIANVGDSEVVACLDGVNAIKLTDKHWPKDDDELTRIIQNDGRVIFNGKSSIVTYEQDHESIGIHTLRTLRHGIHPIITKFVDGTFFIEKKFIPTARMSWKNSDRTLAVSRAIGDIFYKPLCTAYPCVKSIKISKPGFAILASDGLWDVMEPQVAVDFIRYSIEKLQTQITNITEEEIRNLAAELVDIVLKLDISHDNITIMIVCFWPA